MRTAARNGRPFVSGQEPGLPVTPLQRASLVHPFRKSDGIVVAHHGDRLPVGIQVEPPIVPDKIPAVVLWPETPKLLIGHLIFSNPNPQVLDRVVFSIALTWITR